MGGRRWGFDGSGLVVWLCVCAGEEDETLAYFDPYSGVAHGDTGLAGAGEEATEVEQERPVMEENEWAWHRGGEARGVAGLLAAWASGWWLVVMHCRPMCLERLARTCYYCCILVTLVTHFLVCRCVWSSRRRRHASWYSA